MESNELQFFEPVKHRATYGFTLPSRNFAKLLCLGTPELTSTPTFAGASNIYLYAFDSSPSTCTSSKTTSTYHIHIISSISLQESEVLVTLDLLQFTTKLDHTYKHNWHYLIYLHRISFLPLTYPINIQSNTMALKDRFRRAVSSTARKESLSSTSPSSSPPSSGYTTPTLSRTPSTVQLPTLIHASTAQTSSDKSLKLTKTSSSGFSKLSRFMSSKSEFERHAPKNYKFSAADPAKVAAISGWEWNYGASRPSVSSECRCPLTL